MECLLVFDHLNDLVYSKYNKKFAKHINEFANIQGFSGDTQGEVWENNTIDANIIVQVFSPIITSQRIMSCQFGNSYTSIQCDAGLNICFDEFMGYLFVNVGDNDVPSMKHFLRNSISLVRYLCGPDICQLKDNERTAAAFTSLIDSLNFMKEIDQAVFVEAVEQLVVNSELSSVTIQALKKAVEKFGSHSNGSRMHAMILVKHKFLSLYSSQNAKELAPSDILFSTILTQSTSITKELKTGDEEFKTTPSPTEGVHSFQVLLAGSDHAPSCLPHVIHILPIGTTINLLFLLEVGNSAVSSSLYEAFCHLHALQLVQIQREIDTLRPAFENLDTAVKRLLDALKKTKNPAIEGCSKQVGKKWEITRKKYQEFLKNNSDEALLRAETLTLGFLENLKQLLNLTSIDDSILISTQSKAQEAGAIIKEKLDSYSDFLQVKALNNYTLGSRDSLTITKYLEEFPGLVHFLYVDRTNHRITAPPLDFTSEETNKLTKKKIWSMIEFSRNHLQEGNLSLIWKDTIFSYAYFLWFEDTSGTSLKPTIFPTNSTKALPLPGLLGSDFYQKLKEVCFPKMPASKIRCFELFCVHLGLVTASCVLEHTRRLSATIWELRGLPALPIELL